MVLGELHDLDEGDEGLDIVVRPSTACGVVGCCVVSSVVRTLIGGLVDGLNLESECGEAARVASEKCTETLTGTESVTVSVLRVIVRWHLSRCQRHRLGSTCVAHIVEVGV